MAAGARFLHNLAAVAWYNGAFARRAWARHALIMQPMARPPLRCHWMMESFQTMSLIRTSSAAVALFAALLAGCATQQTAKTADPAPAATTATADAAAPLPAAGCTGNACDSAPQLLTGASPRYPYPAGSLAQPASVRVQFVVNTDGSVSDVKTLTTTSKDMASEVERAVRQWKYRPAMKSNQPLKVILQQQFDFKP